MKAAYPPGAWTTWPALGSRKSEGFTGSVSRARKENGLILSKLGELGKRAFRSRETWKEIGYFLSKLGKLGKETFRSPGAWKEIGRFLSKLRGLCKEACKARRLARLLVVAVALGVRVGVRGLENGDRGRGDEGAGGPPLLGGGQRPEQLVAESLHLLLHGCSPFVSRVRPATRCRRRGPSREPGRRSRRR